MVRVFPEVIGLHLNKLSELIMLGMDKASPIIGVLLLELHTARDFQGSDLEQVITEHRIRPETLQIRLQQTYLLQ